MTPDGVRKAIEQAKRPVIGANGVTLMLSPQAHQERDRSIVDLIAFLAERELARMEVSEERPPDSTEGTWWAGQLLNARCPMKPDG